MNYQQYLLIKLAEEATEVAQIALKTAQFGSNEKMPGQPFTNNERIYQELNDLMGIIFMLNAEEVLTYSVDSDAIAAKVAKVNKFLQYSVDLGTVQLL